jgi:glyceraldehyde-3-phosphate dehydrogenase (NADP+)
MKTKGILIGGEFRDGSDSIAVVSPFSGEEIASVGFASGDQFSEAVGHAVDAGKELRGLSRLELADGLRKIANVIEQRSDEFARTIALESAKPLIYSRGEVGRAISTFRFAATEAERFSGEVVPVDAQANGRGKTAYTKRIPRGVIYGITPFNFPLNLVAHKVAPALASRNSIIIKPSPRTPLTALLLGEAFLESGLPAAALQVVPMDTELMNAAYNDERIAMISFTGGAAVGWDIKSKAGKKAVALELGGNAPVIIDKTADLQKCLDKTTTAAFAYSGQVCISAQRVYAHREIFKEVRDGIVSRAKEFSCGDPLDEKTKMSVMIDEASAKRAESWIREAVDNGAELLCGGDRKDAYLSPAVLTRTDPEMRVVAEEAFAPLVVVESFDHFNDALEMANNSKYGLQAAVFTNDARHADAAAERLEYGGVIINDAPTFRVDNMPYGGSKESGFGREGVRYAMEEMTEIRIVVSSR